MLWVGSRHRTSFPFLFSPKIILYSAGIALLKYSEKLPPSKRDACRETLEAYFQQDVTEDLIQTAATFNTKCHTQPHGLKVYNYYKSVGVVQLEKRWREWFIESMQPRHLPDNWSLTHNLAKMTDKMKRHPVDSQKWLQFQTALHGVKD